MMQQFGLSETRRPIDAPMDFNVGRITPRETLAVAGATVTCLFVSSLGGMLSYWAYSAPNFFFTLFGTLVALVCWIMAALLVRLSYETWRSYQYRLDTAFDVYLDAIEKTGGEVVERRLEVSSLLADEPLHVLGVALAVHHRLQNADNEKIPYSVRELQGPIILNGRMLGRISTVKSAQEIGAKMAELGLITGRSEKSAGKWSASSTDDVIKALTKWKG